MPTRNINLTDRYDRFVEDQVTSGRFKNASEVMRAGLRLLEQQTGEERQKLEALRALAAQAFGELDQGRGIVFQDEDQLTERVGRIGRRAAARSASRTKRD